MKGLDVSPVQGRREMDEFLNFPWKIYGNDPNWVPPLKWIQRRLLDTARHPFWKFSERVLLLARRGGRTVGRIAGIVDRNYNQFHDEKMGAWGFFESENDPEVAAALFAEAEGWVRERGMTFFRGPLNPSTNYEVGTLIEGFESPPAIMMTYNPPYYIDLIQAYGFRKEKDLIAYILEPDFRTSERVRRLAGRVLRNGNIRLRTINRRDLLNEARLINDIYRECWAENWGFVPPTDEEVRETARNLGLIADPELVFFLYYKDEPAGVAVVLPDINPLLQRLNGRIGFSGLFKILRFKSEVKAYRGLLFGFKKAYQKLGVSLVAFDYLNRKATERAYKFMELSWNLEDNDAINQYDREVGGRAYKRYRIYRKEIT
ncbi:MAG: acyl-CoA N-acyltransferase [Desulfomonile tiedjei]|nr:acyl-CoA N-acyltransferase [Desulfomonile tiedjei]